MDSCVADEHPGAWVVVAGDRQQVTPGLGLVLGGQIQPGHPRGAHPAGWRPQQIPLCRLGHRPRPPQFPGTPLPHVAMKTTRADSTARAMS